MALGPEGFLGENEGKKALKVREDCEDWEKNITFHTQFWCPFFAQSCMQNTHSLEIS